jgi:UTP--glucose-1-phosphate uridylyltransferase
MLHGQISKAIFPVAGLGTRFLPATKASAKEMMPVVDKPLIQYAVEEAVAAGIKELIFVTGRGKRAIEDHFDRAVELEMELEERGNHALLKQVRGLLPAGVSCAYVRQVNALGLGHAVLCAAPLIGDEPFAVLLADDLIDARVPVLKQMVEEFNELMHAVIAVERVPRNQTDRYGIVKVHGTGTGSRAITKIVEKPKPKDAPSDLGVVGRYILPASIFRDLRALPAPSKGKELQLTDAIAKLLAREPAYAYPFKGVRYDCGSKLGYAQANLAYALAHPEVGATFRRYLASGAWKQDR